MDGPTEGSTEALLWLDSGGGEDLDKPLEMRSRRGRPRSRMKVILVVGVERSGVG